MKSKPNGGETRFIDYLNEDFILKIKAIQKYFKYFEVLLANFEEFKRALVFFIPVRPPVRLSPAVKE